MYLWLWVLEHNPKLIVTILPYLLRSLNSWFGSGVMTKSGIILNNQMASFQLPDSSGQTLSKQVCVYLVRGV